MSTETAETAEVKTETEAAMMSVIEKEHYDRIVELNEDIDAASYSYEGLNDRTKSAKKNLESLQLQLNRLISEGPKKPDPQQQLPFDDDSWKLVATSDVLTLSEKQMEKLDAAGALTVGEFERLRAGQNPDYPNGLLSVKGFGQATIDKLEEEMLNWLAKNAREPEPTESEGQEA